MTDKQHLSINLLRLFDLVLVLLSFGLTTAILVDTQGGTSFAQFLSMRTKVSNYAIFLLALLICHLVFSMRGLYRSRRLSNRRGELADVSLAMTLSVVCFAIIGSVFSVQMITLPFLALFWALSTTVLCASRLLLRAALARIRTHGRNLRYMLILGTNSRAIEFARRVCASPERGYRLLGFVDDEWPGLTPFKSSGFSLVSDYGTLAEYLRCNIVDEVAIFLPFGSFYKNSAEVVSLGINKDGRRQSEGQKYKNQIEQS